MIEFPPPITEGSRGDEREEDVERWRRLRRLRLRDQSWRFCPKIGIVCALDTAGQRPRGTPNGGKNMRL